MMDYPEYKKRRLRNEERLAVMKLDMLTRSFGEAVCALESRLGGYKYAKRDVSCVVGICKKLVREALGECPADIAAQIIRQSRDYCIGLERRSVTRRMDEVVMPMNDEWQFIHICLDSRCSICLKTPTECRECKVRALLRRYVDEPEPEISGACGFMGCDLSDSKKLNKQERL